MKKCKDCRFFEGVECKVKSENYFLVEKLNNSGSLSNGVGKKQINFYMAPVDFPLELFCYQ
ncbi:hypothetical protein [Fusobacterium mortiferum]|uniref:Uncharacterized protein n=1 Tax=Fusobacterium mortiferum TaxID=850 RepID=A0ABS2G558_FUSMR|nr:hypothetical protein [Fusobacterium mortiferum]MBM6876247.1 hypothetical protein [Fusobacterium mortiferum]